MKRMFGLLALWMILMCSGVSVAADTPWIDMSCEMCKNFTAQPGLMEAMQHESYEISNGCVFVTVVDEAHDSSYVTAMSACHVIGEKLMAGEQMHLCGMCSAIGQSMAMGAQMDMLDTDAGHLMILTAADPKAVEHLHMIVAKNREAYSAMKQG